MNANTQIFLNNFTTTGTGLRGVLGINCNQLPASVFRKTFNPNTFCLQILNVLHIIKVWKILHYLIFRVFINCLTWLIINVILDKHRTSKPVYMNTKENETKDTFTRPLINMGGKILIFPFLKKLMIFPNSMNENNFGLIYYKHTLRLMVIMFAKVQALREVESIVIQQNKKLKKQFQINTVSKIHFMERSIRKNLYQKCRNHIKELKSQRIEVQKFWHHVLGMEHRLLKNRLLNSIWTQKKSFNYGMELSPPLNRDIRFPVSRNVVTISERAIRDLAGSLPVFKGFSHCCFAKYSSIARRICSATVKPVLSANFFKDSICCFVKCVFIRFMHTLYTLNFICQDKNLQKGEGHGLSSAT